MLNERVSPQTVGILRILVFGYWLLNVSMVHLEDLAALPLEVLSGWGALYLIPGFLWQWMWTPLFLFLLKGCLIGGLIWLILGLPGYQRVAIVTCVLITLFDGMEKSLGHINHSKFAMLYSAYILALFPCIDAVALARRPSTPRPASQYIAPVVLISVLFILTYSMMGVYRLDRSGFELFASDAMRNWFLKRSFEMSSTGFQWGLWFADRPLLMIPVNLSFPIISMLELASPLCLVSRWFRWIWVVTMVSFHIGSLFTMNIFFWQNALLILVVMTNSDRLFAPKLPKGVHPIVFFDGECGLCNRTVRTLMAADLFGIFHYAPLQGSTARTQLRGRDETAGDATLVLLDETGFHERSDAVLAAFGRLGGLWGGVAAARVLPRAVRDRAYALISRNRIRWFGRVESCALVRAEDRDRLLP